MNENKSGLCTAGMVLGIVGVCLFWLGCMGCIGFIPNILGIVFSSICLAKKKQPRWQVITGLVTSIVGFTLATIVAIIQLILVFL